MLTCSVYVQCMSLNFPSLRVLFSHESTGILCHYRLLFHVLLNISLTISLIFILLKDVLIESQHLLPHQCWHIFSLSAKNNI